MIEQGFYNLITSGLNDATITGSAIELPKDVVTSIAPKAWLYRSVQSNPLYTNDSESTYTTWYVIIDCFGFTADDARTLADKIEAIIRANVAGVTLSDDDHTKISMVRSLGRSVEGFDSDNRSFYKSLSYCVNYFRQ